MTAYNDRIMNDLSSYKGNFNEKVFAYLVDEGYTGSTLPELLVEAGMTISSILTEIVTTPPVSGDALTVILLGQSEIEHLFNTATYYNLTTVPDVTGTNVVVVRQDGDLVAPTEYEVTNENIAAGLVSHTMGALACMIRDVIGSSIKVVIGDAGVAGSSRTELFDSSDDINENVTRYWQDFTSVVDLIETNYGTVNHLIECWYNADQASISQFSENFWPMYFGVDYNSTPVTIGTTYTGPTVSYQLDHCIWDSTAASNEKGRGIFTRDDTTWHIVTPMVFSDGAEDPEAEDFNFSSGDYRLTEPDREAVIDLESKTEAQSVRLTVGPSAHLADFNGTAHPNEDGSPDGKGLFASAFVPAVARASKESFSTTPEILEPYISDVTGPESGEYVDIEIQLPNNGTLTTLSDFRTAGNVYDKRFVQSLRYDKSTRGCRTPQAFLKKLGVDTLPTGITYNSSNDTVTIAEGSSTDSLIGWDFSGVQMIWRGHVTTVRDCLFTERTSQTTYSIIDGYTTGSIGTLERCTFIGDGPNSVIGAAISGRVTAPTDTFVIDTLRRCEFFNIPEDIIKCGWSGKIVENYFDSPNNLPVIPQLWSSSTTYAVDDYVYVEGTNNNIYAFKSLQGSNLNNQPPTSKTDTAFWESVDPHVDAVNPFAIIGSGLLVAGNYINMDPDDKEYDAGGYSWGITNNIRAIRNNGTDVEFVASVFRNNILARGVQVNGEKANSTPSQLPDISGDISNGYTYVSEVQTFSNNWIESNFNGDLWYAGDEEEHIITDNILYDGVREVLSPHKQSAVGFETYRSGEGNRKPVMQPSETSYSENFRGEVFIYDYGSGSPKTGKVRIIPETLFEAGDSFSYLRGQASAQLLKPRDVTSKLYLDMLLEHIPQYYNQSNDYTYVGVPVRPLQTDIVSPVPAAAFQARAVTYDGTDAAYTTATTTLGDRGTISFWYYNTDTAWNQFNRVVQTAVSSDGKPRIDVSTYHSGQMVFSAWSGSANILRPFYSAVGNVPFATNQWYLVQISWISGNSIQVAVNNQVVLNTTLPTMDTTNTDQFGIGSDRIGRTTPYNYGVIGDLAHVYVNTEEYLDMSVITNRQLFTDGANPIDLGVNGELPTGTAPSVYMDGDTGWNNQGSIGPFTITGTLDVSANIPNF